MNQSLDSRNLINLKNGNSYLSPARCFYFKFAKVSGNKGIRMFSFLVLIDFVKKKKSQVLNPKTGRRFQLTSERERERIKQQER